MWLRLRRALKVVLALVVLLLAGILVYGTVVVRRSYPQTRGTLAVAGLEAPVEVVRDRWGVPHLFAGSAHDLVFAQGFVVAQDRSWQMELNRGAANGRLSALFGAAALDADRYLRTVGLRRSAEKDLALLTPETKALVEAYAAGVNAFLDGHRDRLPIEFRILGVSPEPWTALDVLAFSKAMSFNLSLNSALELLRAELAADVGAEQAGRFLAPYPADAPVIVSPAAGGYGQTTPLVPTPEAENIETVRHDSRRLDTDRFLAAVLPAVGHPGRIGGSNAWVVAGSRTASGKPLLANDTHLALGMPSIWYEIGLHGGGFDVSGFCLPGVPFVVIGQNTRLAWGITNLNADVQDVYLEKLDAEDNPTRYQLRGAWQPVEVVHESIQVKGGQPVDLPVFFTQHGPLMHKVTPGQKVGQPFSLAWPALAGSRLLDAMHRLDLASDWPSFRQALSMWDSPSLNFVYADVDGNIGYQSTAQVPKRVPGHLGTVPVDGSSGEFEWQGLIPFDEMPSAENPPEGFFATANNKVVSDDYPHVLTRDWPPADRARRITALLQGGQGLTVDDMRKMQSDTLSLPAVRLRPILLAAAKPANEAERAALALASDWDLRYAAESAGATVYAVWLDELVRGVIEDDLSKESLGDILPLTLAPTPIVEEILTHPDDPLIDDKRTAEKETLDLQIDRSFHRAVAWLGERLGAKPASWQWGRLHQMTFVHQPLGASGIAPLVWLFNSPARPAAGDGSTIMALAGNPADRYKVVFGPSQRFVADLSDLSRSLAVNSTGQVGAPFHRHRDDLIALWGRGELHPVLTTRQAVDAQGEPGQSAEVLTLQPTSSPSRP